MTLTAIRPDLGLVKGQELSLYKLSQAASWISALRVFFNDL